MDQNKLKSIIEASLMALGDSMSLDQMLQLFEEESQPEKKQLREVLAQLDEDYQGRGMQIIETGSGWRIQVRAEYADWVSRMWDEKPARYSRALLETLALVAYRQPITRGEIEDVRGVSVSTNIMKTLLERDWVRVVGHRDVPGKPSLYATTRVFLDYFNLKSLNDLPSLAEIKDLDSINQELELNDPDKLEEKAKVASETNPQIAESVTDDESENTQDQDQNLSVKLPVANQESASESQTSAESEQVTENSDHNQG